MSLNHTIKALVVDDSSGYRKIISMILQSLPNVQLVGTANDGRQALKMIEELKPDLITLDVQMPEMDGIETLEHLKKADINVITILISSLTSRGADISMKALELGAFDFITKPDGTSFDENYSNLKKQLKPKVDAASIYLRLNKTKQQKAANKRPEPAKTPADTALHKNNTFVKDYYHGIDVVAIGVSTGGPNALSQLIPLLPADLPVPILIVQHMPALFTKALAESLNKKSALEVREAVDAETILPGKVYLAPGGSQMKIEKTDSGSSAIKITDDPPEKFCKPSVDYMFRSVAQVCKERSIGIVLTGMGSDGAIGTRLIKRAGGRTVAQDESTCVVYGMPKEAVGTGAIDTILPLTDIAGEILRKVLNAPGK